MNDDVTLTEKELADLARWADEHGGIWYLAYGRAIERAMRRKWREKNPEKEPLIECQRCGRFIK